MTIAIGDRIPNTRFQVMKEKGPRFMTTNELLKGKKVVIFGLPGAFTPTCSAAHMPGFVVKADEILAAGADAIVCHSVNDAYVMTAWQKDQNAEKIIMLADGSGDFSRNIGAEIDRREAGMGFRVARYVMIVDDCVVKLMNREEPGQFEVSDAETVLQALSSAV
jgi:glutaredoxin/glutathione-dependent peroxiredoxin